MQPTLWVAYPFPGPWQVPLHPLAAVLASSPLPTAQGAASIPMTASPRAWLSQSCCLRAHASFFYFRLSLHEKLADDYLRLLPDVMLRRSSFLPSHSVPPEACNQLICITWQMYPGQLAQGHCFPVTKHLWFFCPNLKLSLLESDILWLLPNYQLGAEQLRFCRVKKVMPTSGLLNLSTTDILC